jgi:hypothetical protein
MSSVSPIEQKHCTALVVRFLRLTPQPFRMIPQARGPSRYAALNKSTTSTQ